LTINIKPKQAYRYQAEECDDTPRHTWTSPHSLFTCTGVRFQITCPLLATYDDKNWEIKTGFIIKSLDRTPWHLLKLRDRNFYTVRTNKTIESHANSTMWMN